MQLAGFSISHARQDKRERECVVCSELFKKRKKNYNDYINGRYISRCGCVIMIARNEKFNLIRGGFSPRKT